MGDRWFDLALWLTPVSAWPEIVEQRAVDAWVLPYEVIQALMQERGETYAYKAVVSFGAWPPRRYWHVRLLGSRGLVKLPVSVGEVVKQVWCLFEVDGIDPVEVSAWDALELVRIEASCEPAGVCALWWRAIQGVQGPRAQEGRVFVDGWNGRRSLEVRCRLLTEMDHELSETRRQ